MAKTKMFNVHSAFMLNRPDGTSETFQPGLQEISTEKYEGKVAGFDKDGKPAQVDHADNANSDATHWHVLANATPVETKEEQDRAAADNAATLAGGVTGAPQAAKADGGTKDAADKGRPIPNA